MNESGRESPDPAREGRDRQAGGARSPDGLDEPIVAELWSIERLEQQADAGRQPRTRSAPILAADLPWDRGSPRMVVSCFASYRALERAIREERRSRRRRNGSSTTSTRGRGAPGDPRRPPLKILPGAAQARRGPLKGYPRVLGLAWAYVAQPTAVSMRTRCVGSCAPYQRVQALTIGELWAVAITLRIVLVENLRRLSERHRLERVRARGPTRWRTGCSGSADPPAAAARSSGRSTERHWTLRGPAGPAAARPGPRPCPALRWLDERRALRARRPTRSSASSTRDRQP